MNTIALSERSTPRLRHPVALAGSNITGTKTPTVGVAVGVGVGVAVMVADVPVAVYQKQR